MTRIFIVIGALLGFLGVGIGAFGTHALEAHFLANPGLEGTYNIAADYQMYHALGLLAIAWLHSRTDSPLARLAGWLFVAGVVLFSGSLYALAVFNIPIMGAVAPLGGVSFLGGWLLFGLAAWRNYPSS